MRTALCFDYVNPSTLLLLKELKRPSPFSAIRGSLYLVKKGEKFVLRLVIVQKLGHVCCIQYYSGHAGIRAAAKAFVNRDFVSFATRAVS